MSDGRFHKFIWNIYEAHQTNVWWTMKIFHLHCLKPGCHMLVTVSEQGANIGGLLYISYIKWLVSSVYLKYCQTNATRISIWRKNSYLLYWHKISRWHDKLLCCHRVKIFEFTRNTVGGIVRALVEMQIMPLFSQKFPNPWQSGVSAASLTTIAVAMINALFQTPRN